MDKKTIKIGIKVESSIEIPFLIDELNCNRQKIWREYNKTT